MRGVKYGPENPGTWTGRQEEAFENSADPRGQLYRSWQPEELLLRTLLKHRIGQATTELEPLGVPGVPLSRIPEIVELAKKIRRRRPDILRTIRLISNARPRGVLTTGSRLGPHGPRIPPRHQPHRPGHAPMRRTRHISYHKSKNLTHENSRSLSFALALRQANTITEV